MVVCLEQGADLHMAQLMPLPHTVSCFSKIQIGFAFLILADPGSLGKRAVKRVCAFVILSPWMYSCECRLILFEKYGFSCSPLASAMREVSDV